MTGAHARPRRARARVALICTVVAAAAFSGCADFRPLNQYDTRYPLQMRVAGSDTAYAIGQIVAFTVSSTPAWAGDSAVWTADAWKCDGYLASLGGGRFQVIDAHYYGDTTGVTVALGPHVAHRSIVLQQRVARVTMSPDSQFTTADGVILDYVYGAYDSSGAPIGSSCSGRPLPAHTIISRDTSVVRVDSQVLRSVHSGRTYVVAELDGVRDSLPVRVEQRPTGVKCDSAWTLSFPMNDTVHITLDHWADWNGHPMEWTPVVTNITANPYTWAPFAASVTTDGTLYTGSQQGQGTLQVDWRSPDGTLSGTAGGCTIYVQ